MVVGPLSEWVSAFAEILAVCVALFLPYYTAHRASKARQKKFAASIAHLTEVAETGDETARKELTGFFNVRFLISNNSKEQELITTGMEILRLLDSPITQADKEEINRLLASIKRFA